MWKLLTTQQYTRVFIGVLFLCMPVHSLVANPAQSAIASAHPLATKAGLAIMAKGGNAFDAAIAVTTVLAVVEPYSSGIGGGGFYLLRTKNNQTSMLDARERAPLAATKNLYLDKNNQVIPKASITGALSAGIPGIPAALVQLAKNYGKLSLKKSMAAAIGYAENGFLVDEYYQKMAGFRLEDLRQDKSAREIFLENDQVPALGYKIIQKDLAKTLKKIAVQGFSGFYKGDIAEKMLASVQKNGGIWQAKDLASYRIIDRSPTVSYYKGMKITMASLPSSGGLVISEIVKILARFELEKMNKAQRTHYIVEAMRRAYRDRAQYMGDLDFVNVPDDYLTSEKYINLLSSSIKENHASSSATLPDYKHSKYNPPLFSPPTGNGSDTTHFSIVDKENNMVSATLSINYPFGACFVAEGTGVLLNDEMDDFSAKPGVANVYGLVGSHANAIAGGKRMLSSMTPTIAETKDKIAIIGTPGGSRIISMVLLGLLNFYENKSAQEIVEAKRFHHQYLPDNISFEPESFDETQVKKLQKLGHKIKALSSDYGNMQVIVIDKKTQKIDAASDPRGIGSAQISP